MHTTAQLLDAAKVRHDATDYRLAQLAEVYPSAIANWRAGRNFPNDEVARRLAGLAGLDEGYVMVCMHAERAANEETRSLWSGIAHKLAAGTATAAAVFLSAGITYSPDASAMAKVPNAASVLTVCILC